MLHPVRIVPQAFKVVEFPVLVVEDMYHDVYVVHQRPLGALFYMIRFLRGLFSYLFFYIVGYCFYLNVRFCLAQNKKIGYGLVYFPKIERYDLVTFLVLNCF